MIFSSPQKLEDTYCVFDMVCMVQHMFVCFFTAGANVKEKNQNVVHPNKWEKSQFSPVKYKKSQHSYVSCFQTNSVTFVHHAPRQTHSNANLFAKTHD